MGLIDEAYRQATPDDLPALDGLFAKRLNDAKQSRNRLSVQRLIQQWRGLDWSRRLVVQDEDRSSRKRSPIEIELQLLDAAGSADPLIASQAIQKLASRLDRQSYHHDAAVVRKRISREFPTIGRSDDPVSMPQVSKQGAPRGQTRAESNAAWPAVEPEFESLDERNYGINYALIPVHAEPGSLAERLDICVERAGTEILFRGDAFFQSGQDEEHERKFKLPPSTSALRGAIYKLREAWGIGRIVVMLVGSELFATAPLDDYGEPNNKPLLWANSIDLQGVSGESRVVMGPAGANEGQYRVVDQSNRPIGRIGPVRAGYLCFQKGTKLVAAETETGRVLWERLDFSSDATVLGDDHFVFAWHENNVVETLSAIDGRKIEERVLTATPSQMVHQIGAYAWTITRGDRLRLEMHDLRRGNIIWSHMEAPDAQLSILDQETIGLATPDGRLHLLAARTGVPLCEPLKVNTDSMAGLVSWQDSERWYVAVTQPTGNLTSLKNLQPNDSVRRRFMSGTLLAIDRELPRILWQRTLKDEPIALDQSRASPVLIQLWKQAQSIRGKSGATEGILRVIDKRTGKVLLEKRQDDLPPYYLLNPDLQQGILELKLQRETIRFRYSNDEPADALNVAEPSESRPPQ